MPGADADPAPDGAGTPGAGECGGGDGVCLIAAPPGGAAAGKAQHSDRDLLDAHLAAELRHPPTLPPAAAAPAPAAAALALRGDAAGSAAFRGRACVVRGLLTAAECAAVRDACAAEGMPELLLCGGTKRRCTRVAFRCPELDRRLWERVRPAIGDAEVCDRASASRFLSRGMDGVWQPERLSGVLRVVRYTAGGHISPHYDGEWVDGEDSRSLKTILIYLNPTAEYSGGVTRFLDHRDDDVAARYTTTPAGDTRGCDDDVVAAVAAEEGAGVVFDAKMLHEGTEVTGGEKWLLRADIVYRRVERAADMAEGSVRSRATQLLNDAEWLEEEGRLTDAVAKYRAAYRLCPELEFERD